MNARVVSATEFKAKCLGLLDEIEQGGGTITITKRGRPVAVLGPTKIKPWKSCRDILKGRMEIVGDIVNSDPSIVWDCLGEEEN